MGTVDEKDMKTEVDGNESIASVATPYPSFLKVLPSSAQNGSSEDDLYVKVPLSEIITLDGNSIFPSLQKLRRLLVSLDILADTDSALCLRYRDEEGHLVALAFDETLSDALMNSTEGTLKITVVKKLPAPGNGRFLKSTSGKYLVALKKSVTLKAKVNDCDAWDVINLYGGKVALRSSNNTFLTAFDDWTLRLTNGIGEWEAWTVVHHQGRAVLRSHHKNYLSISNDGRTIKLVNDLGHSEQWMW